MSAARAIDAEQAHVYQCMLFLSLISPLASNYLSYVPAVFTTKMEAKYCHTHLA